MNEISPDQARRTALEYLQELYPDGDVGVVDAATRQEDFGWVFFYDSRTYLESGDSREMLFGNAPLIVDRAGELYTTGTAMPVEAYLSLFRGSRIGFRITR